MLLSSDLDLMSENFVIISGEKLLFQRHISAPPNFTIAIRNPQKPDLVYEILREEIPAEHKLQLIGEKESVEIKLEDIRTNDRLFENWSYLLIPPLTEERSFENFQNTVAILRGPHGCPWDKKQTHQSIRDCFLQEAYELLDGLDRADTGTIIEELGDILFHIVLQTQMAIDNNEFNMGDVISNINKKIITRHVHVFGNPEQISPDQVSMRWEEIKQKEREKKHKSGGLLDGISRSMPALSMAYSYQDRSEKAGFKWANQDSLWDKLSEELEEFRSAAAQEEKEEELGDILFCVVNLARICKIDPETALRMANRKFYERVHYIENRAKEQGKNLFQLTREEKEAYWNEFKAIRSQNK